MADFQGMDEQKKSRAGRPTAEQALRRSLEPFRAAGFDHSIIDPLNIVALLAADPTVAHETRLAAALALHDRRGGAGHSRHDTQRAPAAAVASTDPGPPDDEIGRRTLEVLKRGTSR